MSWTASSASSLLRGLTPHLVSSSLLVPWVWRGLPTCTRWVAATGHRAMSTASSALSTSTVESTHHDVLEITKQGLLLDKPAPTAVLLGWVGCQMRYLRKYAQVYADLGFNTVCGIMPTSSVFSGFTGPATDYGRFVMHTLATDKALHTGGVVISPFSNGGCIAYRYILDVLNNEPEFEDVRKNIKAVVMDSAPCYMTIPAGTRALSMALQVTNPIMYGLVFVGFTLFALTLAPWSRQTPTAFWNAMRDWDLGDHVMEAYLVSEVDKLMDFPALQALVAERQERRSTRPNGAPVDLVRFADSPHVSHLRTHPDLYRVVQHCRD
ncbi:hypothetical protein PTSG_11714 [Salpingoeca rosetta]|uniref:Transmembrane protein 53 n=1 Tax=Salpingoeca rosetta (strain ATCC 50818 / BSB-021) TaxID=946362 RepID=F2U052_SALR5|nr:uncharacterized protein PTSG_11714 [Salpingoeca rosetta]EGD80780.1 hypothetical protein PTSG_11714 [Salpingoeca rosetta]|eukprot:XP_004997341.1 hypothetical protein PTSG_11714 [Salpingoeca rosetta]